MIGKELKLATRKKFALNLAKLIIQSKVTLSDVGRNLNPKAKNPASVIYAWLTASCMPSDEIKEKIAKFFKVDSLVFHNGDAADFALGKPGDLEFQKTIAELKKESHKKQKLIKTKISITRKNIETEATNKELAVIPQYLIKKLKIFANNLENRLDTLEPEVFNDITRLLSKYE